MPDVDPDLSDALRDVRQAYRLLWSYQRRILDLARVVLAAFPEHEFYAWRPRIGDPPPQLTGNPLQRWAWDFLPLAEACFLFLPGGADRNAPKAGEWMVELRVRADDGHEDYAETGEFDPALFIPAEGTTSSLWLYLWLCDEGVSRNWFNWVWQNAGWPVVDDVPMQHPKGPFRIVGRKVDLATLPDRAAVEAMVTDFRAMATQVLGLPA